MRPLSFTEVLELGAPSEKVFAYMIDPETAGTIDPTIIEWRASEYPPRVGTLNHLTGKFGPLRVRLTSRFDECDPPRRMVLQGIKPPFARWTRGTHDLEEIAGGMRYTYTVEMRPPVGLRSVSRLVLRSMQRGVREGCERLLDVFGPPSRA